jgi:hypothetical protein
MGVTFCLTKCSLCLTKCSLCLTKCSLCLTMCSLSLGDWQSVYHMQTLAVADGLASTCGMVCTCGRVSHSACWQAGVVWCGVVWCGVVWCGVEVSMFFAHCGFLPHSCNTTSAHVMYIMRIHELRVLRCSCTDKGSTYQRPRQ